MHAPDPSLYAVLIGIDGYERASGGDTPSDRWGSVAEVEAWEARLLRRGARPENVRWCVSPRGRPRSNATAAKVRDALAWLLERLARPGARGVVVVAAHLDATDGARIGLPSDAALDPDHLVDLEEELLEPAAALTSDHQLTVVVSPAPEVPRDPRIALWTVRMGTPGHAAWA